MTTIRSFIAFQVSGSPDLEKFLLTARLQMGQSAVRWVDPGSLHVTLVFLGDTTEEQLTRITDILERVTANRPEFKITLRGVGYFGKQSAPRVIWLGLDPEPALTELQRTMQDELHSIGITTEDRQYSPHLTLGRVKEFRDAVSFRTLMNTYGCYEFHTMEVKDIILYESILSSTGPVYRPIQSFHLC